MVRTISSIESKPLITVTYRFLSLGRNCRHLKPGHLDKWLVVYEGKQKPIVNELINTLYSVCTPMVKRRVLRKTSIDFCILGYASRIS